MNAKIIFQFAIGPIGASLLGLITLPIVAWIFSPEDIGRLTMLNVAIGFTLLVFSLGLDQAYVREFHEVDDKPALLKSVFLPGFLVLICTLLCVALTPWSPSLVLFGIDSYKLTILLYAAILLSFCSRYLSLILRMQERGFAYSMSLILPKILFLLVLSVYLVFGAESNFDNLIIANFISLLAVFITYTWSTRNDWLRALNAEIDKTKQYQMICFALPLIGSGLAFWGLTALDKLFLRYLSNLEELGIYSISVSFAGAALIFQAIFSTVWAPVVYKWAAEGIEPLKIKEVMDYATIAVVFIWSLTGTFSWIVTYILPPEYSRVQYIILAAMGYPLLYTLSESTGVGIGIKRRTMFSLLAAIIALIVNAVANWFLIPMHGAAGASFSSAIAFFILLVIRTEISARIWFSFERCRMYALMIWLVLISFISNLFELDVLLIIGLYLFTLFLVVVLFSRQIKDVIAYLYMKFI